MTKLVNGIDAADKTAGKPNAAITLYETPPIASYGYTSSNPNAPIFGSSTVAQQGGNKAYAPYVGDANPIAAMASDLHNAYLSAAGTYNAANPTKSHINVALAGDAWVSAINLGIAQQDPFLMSEPAGQVDLWDSNPLLACCTVPIGYHPERLWRLSRCAGAVRPDHRHQPRDARRRVRSIQRAVPRLRIRTRWEFRHRSQTSWRSWRRRRWRMVAPCRSQPRLPCLVLVRWL